MRELEKDKLLIVEGKDELSFFQSFIDEMQDLNPDNIDMVDVGGKNDFGTKIKDLKKVPGFDSVKNIGIFRDSHQNPSKAFNETKDIAKTCNLPIPENHSRSYEKRGQNLLVGLLPKPSSKGELEHLCIMSVSNKVTYSHTEDFIESVKNHYQNELKKEHKAKALGYIAARKHHIRDFRHGCHERVWNYDDDCFNYLKKCLRSIFG